jgi:GDP-D-mannose dehydratase
LRDIIGRFERLSGHRIDVRIDPNFVRENEVHRLCGNSDKLNRLLRAHGRELDAPSLDDTLGQMLEAAGAS